MAVVGMVILGHVVNGLVDVGHVADGHIGVGAVARREKAEQIFTWQILQETMGGVRIMLTLMLIN